MELQIKGHNFQMTDGVRDYVEKRTGKLDRINERIIEAKFEVREEVHHRPDERFIAQFTISTRRAILRAEEKNADMYAAIDLVSDKMARQIRRFHDRRIRRSRREAVNLGQATADIVDLQAADELVLEEALPVVRTKRFKMQPMDISEAIEQIELLGHDFFVFYNLDSNQMNVLYRRRGGDYGLLEPELA